MTRYFCDNCNDEVTSTEMLYTIKAISKRNVNKLPHPDPYNIRIDVFEVCKNCAFEFTRLALPVWVEACRKKKKGSKNEVLISLIKTVREQFAISWPFHVDSDGEVSWYANWEERLLPYLRHAFEAGKRSALEEANEKS